MIPTLSVIDPIWIERNKDDLIFWSSFISCTALLVWLFSDFDFSVLLTLSSLTSMFAFLMAANKILNQRHSVGVSLKMFECYAIVHSSRLLAILPFEGYLPYDSSGDWLYQSVEFLSLLLSCFIVYLIRKVYVSTYDSNADHFNHLYIISGGLIMSILFHPSLNSFMPADIAWTFSLYLESVTVLPQLFMFQRQSKVEAFLTHFLAAQAVSRALSFIFWSHSHHELNSVNRGRHGTAIGGAFVGWSVLGMQLVQLLIMADFIYYYVRCIRKGVSVENILKAGEDV